MVVRVVVEVRAPRGSSQAQVMQMASAMNVPSFQLDTTYAPVAIRPPDGDVVVLDAAGEELYIVCGTIEEDRIAELEAQPIVVRVSRDVPIAPFVEGSFVALVPEARFGDCPVKPCDCDTGVARGTISQVASFLGVDEIWAGGGQGEGIVIGIVDGGITAEGRPIDSADSAVPGLVPRVIGGWPEADWGTTGVAWGWHGNMTATDALGMAPQANIYDIRISDAPSLGGVLSDALAGYQWAIERHREDGTPQVLSNSWGIYQESWAEDYANDPEHWFTRKVVEAIDEGIHVLFAAGNCGQRCPSSRCGDDAGPGRSIWGANGHPRVMTVGAVNIDEQLIGYSSQGPGALDPEKPDFCAVSHFQGYFSVDTGTSAACPIAAGVVALIKQANPSARQEQIKAMIATTAKSIGPSGWDRHSGHGVLRGKAAYDAPADIGRLLAAKGQLTFLRVHDVGTGWGPAVDHLDVEVVARLDSTPDMAYGFQLRADRNEAARRGMLDLLRDAFQRDGRVRIDYFRTGRATGRIIRVMNLP